MQNIKNITNNELQFKENIYSSVLKNNDYDRMITTLNFNEDEYSINYNSTSSIVKDNIKSSIINSENFINTTQAVYKNNNSIENNILIKKS